MPINLTATCFVTKDIAITSQERLLSKQKSLVYHIHLAPNFHSFEFVKDKGIVFIMTPFE